MEFDFVKAAKEAAEAVKPQLISEVKKIRNKPREEQEAELFLACLTASASISMHILKQYHEELMNYLASNKNN